MKRAIHYIGFLFLMCCANVALALESPKENTTKTEIQSDKVLEQDEAGYTFTLFNFFIIKPETRKEEPKVTIKPQDSQRNKP